MVARQGDVFREFNQAFLMVDSFNFNLVDEERSDIYTCVMCNMSHALYVPRVMYVLCVINVLYMCYVLYVLFVKYVLCLIYVLYIIF